MTAPLHTESELRHCAILIVDIAATVELRSRLGDAAGGERISQLLADIVAVATAEGGEFIKSYGDDVMVIFSQAPKITAAARVAVRAQQLATEAGLQLYAGIHAGEVEFRQTMGHPDALGQAINITARLHKLTPNAPGRIFMLQALKDELSAELQAIATPFGAHELKGLGTVNVWTLDWQDPKMAAQTVFSQDTTDEFSRAATPTQADLSLAYRSKTRRLKPSNGRFVIGRSEEAQLCVLDPEVRVSSMHLQVESASGHWFVQDVSRNGTWLFDERIQEETTLPKGHPFSLPQKGMLCLGRPFAADPKQNFTVMFEMMIEDPSRN